MKVPVPKQNFFEGYPALFMMQSFGQQEDFKINRGHVTHIVGASSAIKAVAHVAPEAGAVPLTLTDVHTGSIFTATAVVLHKHTTCTIN